MGVRYFQLRVINWSTLNLGSVHLTQINTKTKKHDFNKNQWMPSNTGPSQPPRKRTVVTADITKRLANSAK